VIRRLLALSVVVGFGIATGLAWLVMNPPVDAAPSGDAIFVHAGGSGERVRAGIALFDAGVAPYLVISDPGGRSSQVPRGLCGSEPSIICVTPSTIDTAGEARALGTLVSERGWDTIVVVTSDYHQRRAAMLDASCTSATIESAPATGRRRRVIVGSRIQETIGLAYSWLFQRC
jgi:uncharacterized SAM-binding protein YcdF (DUF218 family)